MTEDSSQLHFTGKRCAKYVRIGVIQSGLPVSCCWGACDSNWWMAMVSLSHWPILALSAEVNLNANWPECIEQFETGYNQFGEAEPSDWI